MSSKTKYTDAERLSQVRHAQYVNFEINPIHDLLNDLYEHMMDNDSEDVVNNCNKIMYRISSIKRDFKIK